MKKSELRKLIKEELLKEGKHEPTDPRAEMIEIVYDTLFNNAENPQFNVKKVKKQ